jgi:HK97 family phage portal protein
MPSFFSRLFGAAAPAREAKYSRAARLLAMHSIGLPQWTSRNSTAMTREGYERNAVCHRCVRMVAEAAASVPWLMYQGREELIDHPLLALIERPNPLDTSVSFIEAICANLLLYGNAYIESVLIDGQLRELYALRPDRMSVEPGRNGWPSTYVYRALGDEIRYEMRGDGIEPILHIRLFNPLDDYYGFAPLAAAQVALDTHNAASFWNKALLDNSARPSGALVYAGPEGAHLTDAQFDRLKEELEENFSGAENAGRPLLLEGGLDWKALSLSPKDMDFAESKASAAREIALAFGVPPLILGLPGDNTFSNYSEAHRAFWRQTVLPLVTRVQKSFQAWLAPGYGPFRFDYNADRLEALASERAAEWARVGKAPFLSLDEQREAVGYGPAPKNAVFGKDSAAGLERRYSPSQPRVPAGSPEGGQWASGGGGGSGTHITGSVGILNDAPGSTDGGADKRQVAINADPNVASDAGELIQPAQEGGRFSVDLVEQEAQGGHAIARHVGRSKEQLIRQADRNRIGFGKRGIWEDRVGSFTSLLAANSLVNETLLKFQSIVHNVSSGKISFAELQAWFDRPTGYESYRRRYYDPVVIRDTFGVRVILIRDSRSARGFRIKTAYPNNRNE